VAANNLIITLTLFFAGRFIGTLLMSKFRPAALLATFALVDVALCAAAASGCTRCCSPASSCRSSSRPSSP
jgi:fucose permease